MSGDVSKLPKWAQREIGRLTRDLANAKATLAAGPENSNTFADPYMDNGRPLGQDTKVRFRLDDYGENRGHQNYVDCRVDRDLRGESFLYVMGGASIAIEPQSSNTARIRIVQR